jgi:tetratricopeptide (TPR) repeat protein
MPHCARVKVRGLNVGNVRRIRPWCNGSTSGSDPENRGSSPCGRTIWWESRPTAKVGMRLPLACFFLALLGCVKPHVDPVYEGQSSVVVDVANASRGAITPDISKQSAALHHFMLGQLSLGQEDFKGALENFVKTEELTAEPAPLVHTKLADLYLRFGELDKALAASQKAIAEEPSDPYVQLLYAGVLESLNRESEAEPVYKHLIKEYPSKFDAYILLSNLYAKQRRFDEGVQVLNSLIVRDPADALGHFYLGRMYEQMERWDLAEREYLSVVERDPTLTNGSHDLLRVLLRAKKTERVKEICGRILAKDANNVLARKVLGHVMLGESNLDEALKHLQVLQGVESDSSDTRFKVALIQIEKHNYKEAARELNLVLATNPGHSEARYYLASIYAGSGRRKDAVEELLLIEKGHEMFVKGRTFAAFILRQDEDLDRARRVLREALEVEPDNKNLLLYLVVVLREMREYREAESALKEALSKHPGDERLLFNLGLVLHDRERESEALAVMEQIVAINPKNSDALNYVAYTLGDTNTDLARAEQLAKQALELRPSDGFYLDTLGWVQFRMGKLADAEQTLAKAINLSGEDVIVIEHYVDVLLARDERAKAVGVMKAVMDRKLSVKDAQDQDKVAAHERIGRRLRELIRQYPELDSVEKSRLGRGGEQLATTGARPRIGGDELLDESMTRPR